MQAQNRKLAAANMALVGLPQVAFGAVITEPFFLVMGTAALALAAIAWRVGAAWGTVPAVLGGTLVIAQYAFFPHQLRLFDSSLDFVPAFLGVAGSAGAIGFGLAHVRTKRSGCSVYASPVILRAYATAIASVLVIAVTSGVVDVMHEPSTVSAAERDGAHVVRYKDAKTKAALIEARANEPIRVVVDNQDPVFHDFKVKSADIKVDLGPQDEKLVVFTLPAGGYEYVCTLHPGMTGDIVVT